MIPPKIHYCWFGPSPLPRSQQKFIAGWRRLMPEYEFILWNEENAPANRYLSSALRHRNWANASNWLRLYALKNYGGVYLDTDIELIRSLEPLAIYDSFVGFEVPHFDWDGCVNNAVFGSIPHHWFVTELLARIERQFDGTEAANLSSPNMTTSVLKENGLAVYSRADVRGVQVFPTEWFAPYGWHESFRTQRVTRNTFSIHWYKASWLTSGDPRTSLRRRAGDLYHRLLWVSWIRPRWRRRRPNQT